MGGKKEGEPAKTQMRGVKRIEDKVRNNAHYGCHTA
jgi:hypothetical protein